MRTFQYTNKAGVTKQFIAIHDTPKKETEKCVLMKIHYANDPEPRKAYTRNFVKKNIKWEVGS